MAKFLTTNLFPLPFGPSRHGNQTRPSWRPHWWRPWWRRRPAQCLQKRIWPRVRHVIRVMRRRSWPHLRVRHGLRCRLKRSWPHLRVRHGLQRRRRHLRVWRRLSRSWPHLLVRHLLVPRLAWRWRLYRRTTSGEDGVSHVAQQRSNLRWALHVRKGRQVSQRAELGSSQARCVAPAMHTNHKRSTRARARSTRSMQTRASSKHMRAYTRASGIHAREQRTRKDATLDARNCARSSTNIADARYPLGTWCVSTAAAELD